MMCSQRQVALLIGACACLAGSVYAQTPAPTETPAYNLDPTHTSVYWEAVHLGTSTLRGRFDKLSGTVRFDAQSQRIDIGIAVDTASVSTGTPAFDAVLRGTALLDSTAHPQAWFVAQQAQFEGAVPRTVRGELTLRGQSQALTLTAVRWKCGFNPLFRREVCGGDFEATLSRGSLGMTLAGPLVSDEIRLRIQVEGVRADTSP